MATAQLDSIGELDRKVKRSKAEESASRAISAVRAKFVLSRDPKLCFFSSLAFRLKATACWDIPTAATDGKVLLYNPEFFSGMGKDEQLGVVAHEVLHPAFKHHTRRNDRDMQKWNIACDAAINPILLDAGFKLPKGCVIPGVEPFQDLPTGLSAEEYYSKLPDQKKGGKGGGGSGGDGDGNDGKKSEYYSEGCVGGVLDAGKDDASNAQADAEWTVAVAQAKEQVKDKGNLPGSLQKAIGDVLEPTVDWRQVLREFVRSHAKNDYTWAIPNRRYISTGLYMPGMRSEELGHVIIGNDTSGSISDHERDLFAGNLNGVIEPYDCKLTVLHHDTKVAHVQEWTSADGPIDLEPRGGGGTDHHCLFEWVEENCPDDVACMICFTDLYTSLPDTPPDYPVLFACTTDEESAWGKTIKIT
jgi:predicted metal-dependent peptidase